MRFLLVTKLVTCNKKLTCLRPLLRVFGYFWSVLTVANRGFTKISKSSGSIQQMICWWPKTCERWLKKAMKNVQAAKARSGSYAHLPTNRCSKSQRCIKLWTSCGAESQVKQGVRRSKLWRRHLHPSNLCEKLWPLNWTCQYKQTNKIMLNVTNCENSHRNLFNTVAFLAITIRYEILSQKK